MYICTCVHIYMHLYPCILRSKCTANPIWGDIFESSQLKARTSLLPRLSFELWNSIRKCHPKWDGLYIYTCACVYVYVHIYMYICVYLCKHVYASVCTYACTFTCSSSTVYQNTYMYKCILVYWCTYVYVCTCTCTCAHSSSAVYEHIYIYKYILVYWCKYVCEHIYIYICVPWRVYWCTYVYVCTYTCTCTPKSCAVTFLGSPLNAKWLILHFNHLYSKERLFLSFSLSFLFLSFSGFLSFFLSCSGFLSFSGSKITRRPVCKISALCRPVLTYICTCLCIHAYTYTQKSRENASTGGEFRCVYVYTCINKHV